MYLCDIRWDSGDIFRETCTPAGIQRFHGRRLPGNDALGDPAGHRRQRTLGLLPVSTRAVGRHEHDEIRLYVGLRGAVALQDPHDQGGDAYVSAGTYFMHHVVTENHSTPRPRSAPASSSFPAMPCAPWSPGKPRDAGQANSPALYAAVQGGRSRAVQVAARGDDPAGHCRSGGQPRDLA